MKNLISNIFAILWFFGILLETLFFTILMCIGILFFSIIGMLKSGSSLGTLGFAYLLQDGFLPLESAITSYLGFIRSV